MKPHERRSASAYPYYKLARWSPRDHTWLDGRRAYPSPEAATADAAAPGRYRISEVTDAGRRDGEPFEIRDPAA